MPVLPLLSREKTVAKPGFNRWLVPPAALLVHLSIGQVYASSVYRRDLTAHFSDDWLASLLGEQTSIGLIFSIAVVFLGLSAAVFGKWVDLGGPRQAMVTAAALWTTAFLVGSLGIATEQLWLLYLGYGVIGGIGLGIGYISPVSTLIKWFPDRPGVATGMAIMGFGGGAAVASPLSAWLLGMYDPDRAEVGVASGSALASLFLTLGAIYLVAMLIGAALVRVPADGWAPEGFDKNAVATNDMITRASVSANNALRSRQFYLLWIVLFVNVTVGIGILERAEPMIQEFFPDSTAITAAAAAGFVGLLSLANMLGRFGWSSLSDKLGRKNMYMMYLGVGATGYLLLALFGASSVVVFVILTAVLLSFYGGGFATIPAYLRDMFGSFQVGAIHGRLLTAWSAAGIAGPLIINRTLDASGSGEVRAADAAFEAGDYRPALFIMVGLLLVGFVANLLVRPVDSKHHEPEEEAVAAKEEAAVAAQEVPVDAPAAGASTPAPRPRRSPMLVFAWILAGVPLSYGIIMTGIKASQLFL